MRNNKKSTVNMIANILLFDSLLYYYSKKVICYFLLEEEIERLNKETLKGILEGS